MLFFATALFFQLAAPARQVSLVLSFPDPTLDDTARNELLTAKAELEAEAETASNDDARREAS